MTRIMVPHETVVVVRDNAFDDDISKLNLVAFLRTT